VRAHGWCVCLLRVRDDDSVRAGKHAFVHVCVCEMCCVRVSMTWCEVHLCALIRVPAEASQLASATQAHMLHACASCKRPANAMKMHMLHACMPTMLQLLSALDAPRVQPNPPIVGGPCFAPGYADI